MPDAVPTPQTPPRTLDLGGCRVTVIRGGVLRLDGGAMFGIIPKPLWSRSTPADEQNRIQLACNCLIVQWDGPGARTAVIETGHGDKYAEKEQKIFALDAAHWLMPALEKCGVATDDVADVILTHLHFDHAGGLTRRLDPTGAVEPRNLVPTFPRARVHVQRQEFDDARANFGIMHATYREENYTPLDAADAWQLHTGEATPLPGVRVTPAPGHTRGHQAIWIEGRDRTAVFAGDVIPTRAHVGAPYNMGYDLFPLDNRRTKHALLQRLAETDAVLILDHEPETPLMRVDADGDWFRVAPLGADELR